MSITKKALEEARKDAKPADYYGSEYPFDIHYCPGYDGYKPDNLDQEVCGWCGGIKYYH